MALAGFLKSSAYRQSRFDAIDRDQRERLCTARSKATNAGSRRCVAVLRATAVPSPQIARPHQSPVSAGSSQHR